MSKRTLTAFTLSIIAAQSWCLLPAYGSHQLYTTSRTPDGEVLLVPSVDNTSANELLITALQHSAGDDLQQELLLSAIAKLAATTRKTTANNSEAKVLLLGAMHHLAQSYCQSGQLKTAEYLLNRCCQNSSALSDRPDLRAPLFLDRGLLQLQLNQLEQAIASIETARASYKQCTDTSGLAIATAVLAAAQLSKGDFQIAQGLYKDAAESYLQSKSDSGARMALVCAGGIASINGNYNESRTLLHNAEILYARSTESHVVALIRYQLALIDFSQSQFQQSGENAKAALARLDVFTDEMETDLISPYRDWTARRQAGFSKYLVNPASTDPSLTGTAVDEPMGSWLLPPLSYMPILPPVTDVAPVTPVRSKKRKAMTNETFVTSTRTEASSNTELPNFPGGKEHAPPGINTAPRVIAQDALLSSSDDASNTDASDLKATEIIETPQLMKALFSHTQLRDQDLFPIAKVMCTFAGSDPPHVNVFPASIERIMRLYALSRQKSKKTFDASVIDASADWRYLRRNRNYLPVDQGLIAKQIRVQELTTEVLARARNLARGLSGSSTSACTITIELKSDNTVSVMQAVSSGNRQFDQRCEGIAKRAASKVLSVSSANNTPALIMQLTFLNDPQTSPTAKVSVDTGNPLSTAKSALSLLAGARSKLTTAPFEPILMHDAESDAGTITVEINKNGELDSFTSANMQTISKAIDAIFPLYPLTASPGLSLGGLLSNQIHNPSYKTHLTNFAETADSTETFARVARATGDDVSEKRSFAELLRAQPNNHVARKYEYARLKAAGDALVSRKDYAGAARAYRSAIRYSDADSSEIRRKLNEALRDQRINPESGAERTKLAITLLASRDEFGAAVEFEVSAILLDSSALWLKAADAYRCAGCNLEAVRAYGFAALNDHSGVAAERCGDLLVQNGSLSEARQMYLQSLHGNETAQRYLKLADLTKSTNWRAARHYYLHACRLEPYNDTALSGLLEASLHEVSKHPTSHRAHHALAEAYRESGALDAARAEINIASILNNRADESKTIHLLTQCETEKKRDANLRTAGFLLNHGLRTEAGKAYELALQGAGSKPVAYLDSQLKQGKNASTSTSERQKLFTEGIAAFHSQDYLSAYQKFDRCLEQDPKSSAAAFNAGSALFAFCSYSDARKYFQRAVDLDKTDLLSHYWLGRINEHFGDVKQALIDYQLCWLLLERESIETTDKTQSSPELRKIVQERVSALSAATALPLKLPGDSQLHYLQLTFPVRRAAQAFYSIGALADARREMSCAAGLDDRNYKPAELTGALSLRMQDLDGALRWYKQALKLNPRSDSLIEMINEVEQQKQAQDHERAHHIFLEAEKSMSSRKFAAAVHQYEQALGLDSENSTIWWQLGVALAENRQCKQARAAFMKSAKLTDLSSGDGLLADTLKLLDAKESGEQLDEPFSMAEYQPAGRPIAAIANLHLADLSADLPPLRLYMHGQITVDRPEPEVEMTSDVDFGPYLAFVSRRIKTQWMPPALENDYKAVVRFDVQKNGHIKNAAVDSSSGSQTFDKAALQAVSDASPLQALPAGAPPEISIQFTFRKNVYSSSARQFDSAHHKQVNLTARLMPIDTTPEDYESPIEVACEPAVAEGLPPIPGGLELPESIPDLSIAKVATTVNNHVSGALRESLSAATLQDGIKLQEQGLESEAVHQFQIALLIDPSNILAQRRLDKLTIPRTAQRTSAVPARMQLAQAAAATLNFPAAINEYRKVLTTTSSGSAHACLAELLLDCGLHREALNQWQTALTEKWDTETGTEETLSTTPSHLRYPAGNAGKSRCHRRIGDLLLQYSEFAKLHGDENLSRIRMVFAGMEFRRSLVLDPSNARALAGLLRVAAESVALNPCASNRLLLAGAQLLAGNAPEAERQIGIVRVMNPQQADLRGSEDTLTLCLLASDGAPALGSVEEAEAPKLNLETKARSRDAQSCFLQGLSLENLGRYDEARKVFEQALKLAPHRASLLQRRISDVRKQSEAERRLELKTSL